MDVGDECYRVALTAPFDTWHHYLLIIFPWVLHMVAFSLQTISLGC